jgi:hypothetical protein
MSKILFSKEKNILGSKILIAKIMVHLIRILTLPEIDDA